MVSRLIIHVRCLATKRCTRERKRQIGLGFFLFHQLGRRRQLRALAAAQDQAENDARQLGPVVLDVLLRARFAAELLMRIGSPPAGKRGVLEAGGELDGEFELGCGAFPGEPNWRVSFLFAVLSFTGVSWSSITNNRQ